jgi:hypothetical protein
MSPDEINALADRIDHEQLWRRSPFDRADMPQEQRDRLDAGVHLRRHASGRSEVLRALQEGKEFIRGYKFTRADGFSTDRRGCGTNAWHGAINRFSEAERERTGSHDSWPRMMYLAKQVSDEVPRLILKFEQERRGLPTGFKACGHDPRPATPLPDNHLRCALQQQCRACPYLLAIEASTDMTSEAKDEAKAWTCVTHILTTVEDAAHIEEFVYDKGDVAFHEQMIANFADVEFEPEPTPPDAQP